MFRLIATRSVHACLLAGLFAGFFVARDAGADWPQFRGPTGQGIADAKELPVRWSVTENVRWRSEVRGSGWSSPVIAGGRVYLTTAVAASSEGHQSLHVVEFDGRDGARGWETTVFNQAPSRIHKKNSHASPTPIVADGKLYVHFGTHGTACLDVAEGQVLWRTQELAYDPVHGSGGSPVLAGDLLIVSCDGGDRQFVVALDRATGKERWRTKRPGHSGRGFSFSTPLVVEAGGKTEIVSPGSDWVVAYDLDGAEVWRAGYPGGYSVIPRPVLGDGLVYVCSGYDSPTLLAIRAGGRGDVTASHVAWRARRGVPHTPCPLFADGRLYLVSDQGIASCLEAKTGKPLWQERLGGNFSASPLLAGGRIYFLAEDGTATVIAAAESCTVLGKSALGERTLASPAADGEALFIRTAEHLYCIAEDAGNAKDADGTNDAE